MFFVFVFCFKTFAPTKQTRIRHDFVVFVKYSDKCVFSDCTGHQTLMLFLLKTYYFPNQLLSQVLRNDIKSYRNWSIWSQLLCALTGVKHHNIHKTYKIHVFSQNFSKKNRQIGKAKPKLTQKSTKNMKNYQYFTIFLLKKKIVFWSGSLRVGFSL